MKHETVIVEAVNLLGRRLLSLRLLLGLGRAGVPLLDTDEVVRNHSNEDVEENESPDDTEVAPALIIEDVAAGQVLIGIAERAVPASFSGIGVL